MIESAYKLEAGVYLRGDDLDPSRISALLGLEPSKSQFKGEQKKTSTNKGFVTKIGLWALTAKAETADLSALLGELIPRFEKEDVVLAEIAGVQEAYVDVFIAVDADNDGGGTCVLQLSQKNVRALDRLGLPVRFTVAVVKP